MLQIPAGNVLQNRAVVISFFGQWCVDWEAISRSFHHLISDFCFNQLFQAVDPGITDTIRELFFGAMPLLSADNVRRFHEQCVFRSYRDHTFYLFGFKTHCNVHKLFVKERNTRFHTPCRHGFIGTQAVVHMQLAQLTYCFFMEFFRVWCFMEIEITTKQLISTPHQTVPS